MKIDKIKIKVYGTFQLITLSVGILSSLLTNMGMDNYRIIQKPPLTPPEIVFPIVWTILFILMAIGAARVWLTDNSRLRNQSILVYFIQLLFNFFWSVLFFNFQSYGFAFIWIIGLWLLIILMTVKFYQADKIAGLLQLPYLLWVTFAAYLNLMVYQLNK